MKNRIIIMVVCMCVFCCASVDARTYDISVLKKNSHQANGETMYINQSRVDTSERYLIRIGGAARNDDRSPMEIRCATVIRNIGDRQMGVNDIASLTFDPINVGKAIYFVMETGIMRAFTTKSKYYDNYKNEEGWKVAGYIIEFLQNGKVIKHFSNVSGVVGKMHLTDDTERLEINENGYSATRMYDSFSNHTQIYATDDEGEKVELEEVLAKYRDKKTDAALQSNNVVAREKDFEIDESAIESYTNVTPHRGRHTGRLMWVRLRSSERSHYSDAQRFTELKKAVAIIEKRYGIKLKSCQKSVNNGYCSYSFSNSHIDVVIYGWYDELIQITNLDAEKEEEKAAQ